MVVVGGVLGVGDPESWVAVAALVGVPCSPVFAGAVADWVFRGIRNVMDTYNQRG